MYTRVCEDISLLLVLLSLYGICQYMQNGLLYRYLTDMHRNNFVLSDKKCL